MKRKVYN
jgi:hypothetical protein